MSETYRYRYTGQGKIPIFCTPMIKVGGNEYQASRPIDHLDFELVGNAKPADIEEKKTTGTKAGKKTNKKDGEE